MSEITEFHLSTRRGKGSMLKQAFLSGLLAATTVVSFGSVVRADSPNNRQYLVKKLQLLVLSTLFAKAAISSI